ncbi:MAG: hypothetical protein AB7N65_27925 [Vicinamibacterales bacterium]
MSAPSPDRQRLAIPLEGVERAIARSVLFAALFDYPLTLTELRATLTEAVQTPTEILNAYRHSPALQAIVSERDGLFFPVDRHDLPAIRRERSTRSRQFLRDHHCLLTLVCALPFVRLVALSGSIAHLNLERGGDLDLFIVTRGRRVWCTTVAVIVLAKLLGQRRTVCANFVLADTCLVLDQQDLFTASQIIHLKPLLGEEAYRAFVAANPFVSAIYPNFHPAFARHAGVRIRTWPRTVRRGLEWLCAVPLVLAEQLCRRAYRRYLQRRIATWDSPQQVRLEDDCVKLHTHSHRGAVITHYERAVRQSIG